MTRLLTTTNLRGFNRTRLPIVVDTGYKGSNASAILATASSKSWTENIVGPANPYRSMVYGVASHFSVEPANLPDGRAVAYSSAMTFPTGSGNETAYFQTAFQKDSTIFSPGQGASVSSGLFRIPSLTSLTFGTNYNTYTEISAGSGVYSITTSGTPNLQTYFNGISFLVFDQQMTVGYPATQINANRGYRGYNSGRSTALLPLRSGILYTLYSMVADNTASPSPQTADWSHLDSYAENKFFYTVNSNVDPNMKYFDGATTIEYSTSICAFTSKSDIAAGIVYPPIWTGSTPLFQLTVTSGGF